MFQRCVLGGGFRGGGSFFLFGSLTGQIDNFDHGHKGGISQTLAQLDDAGIAALAFRAKRSDFIKQPVVL